jgi:transcriptional regulator with XRE-family HTH domain
MPSKHPQFAKFVTAHREALGLSRNRLAKEVGVHRSNVTYWESGEGLPMASVLEPLARALKVSYEDLFALAGYAHPEGLPEPVPYLRAKFPGISKKALAEAQRLFEDFDDRYRKGGKAGKKGRRQ